MADMVAVIAMLDGRLADEVRRLWAWFETEFGSTAVQVFPHPHVSLHGGHCSNLGGFEAVVDDWVGGVTPFEVTVDGFNFFESPSKTVFLEVVRSATLRRFNRELDGLLADRCDDLFELLRPDRWHPHITLAMDDLTDETFERARRMLANERPAYRQTVTSLALARRPSGDGEIDIVRTWSLGPG